MAIEPTGAQARRYLSVNSSVLSDSEFEGWLKDIQSQTSSTDLYVLLFGTIWHIARSKSWNAVTRLGDKSFTPPNPEQFQQLYLQRCQKIGERADLLGRKSHRVRKVNTELDDKTNLNKANPE